MSRPRKPFGTTRPGRLPATMIKVLAAEMSDSTRLSRGKRYWADDAVIDIVVGHGVLTAEVQGSRPDPYVVTVVTRPGEGIPTRRDLTVGCTCPDGEPGRACKHAVAALFTLSDEVSIEPGLLERWRAGMPGAAHDVDARPPHDEDDAHPVGSGTGRAGSAAGARERSSRSDVLPEVTRRRDPVAEQIAALLTSPTVRAEWPSPAEPAPATAVPVGDPTLGELLDDARSNLEVRW